MIPSIAIVGLACKYPDSKNISEFWDNILAKRRAFRTIPDNRLRAQDFFSADTSAPDRTYCSKGAFLEDYEFDRVRFQVAGSTYRAADLAHWLALDVAAEALRDSKLGEPDSFGRERTGVYVGNSLTGEFSRAQLMRLRWPYVRRVTAEQLKEDGRSDEEIERFLARMEISYKDPFEEVTEESLAGGLSNTIAGRIANYFNLQGGAYTVDGACASSLLAVCNGCSALESGDLDVAVVGGVDVSIDPFEMVGFAKTQALASSEMRIFDQAGSGFLPGEGCGFAVLMRSDDTLALGLRPYAILRGWGISSDGSGGLTRPEVKGQLLALNRAYRRGGFGPDQVAYFEAHGTGTAVGDATELRVLSTARREANPAAAKAAIGSVKANIGHTKAASGIAGLIKASLALHYQIVPPTTGCKTPHEELALPSTPLRIVERGHLWPAEAPLRAAVSAMGFGGINSHVVLEGASSIRRTNLSEREAQLLSTPQDAELFLFSRQEEVERAARMAAGLSTAEMTDLACELAAQLQETGSRAAVVASTPDELAEKLKHVAWSSPEVEGIPRIGFLFPGQAALAKDRPGDRVQERIIEASLAALDCVEGYGIQAAVCVGHSLGELTVLSWAGAMSRETLLELVREREEIMDSLGGSQGAMAMIGSDAITAKLLLNGDTTAVISGLNGPEHTIVSGDLPAIRKVLARAKAAGFSGVQLAVSGAFHSPMMANACLRFGETLAHKPFAPISRRVFSTIAGREIHSKDDIRDLLVRQLVSPVCFQQAIEAANAHVDLWIEIGPGKTLSGLVKRIGSVPGVATDFSAGSQRGVLNAVAAAYRLGVSLNLRKMVSERFHRRLPDVRRFFSNPCESAPLEAASVNENAPLGIARGSNRPARIVTAQGQAADLDAVTTLRTLVAKRAELPVHLVQENSRFLRDLHLNSIVVAELLAEASRSLERPPLLAPLELADATLAQAAAVLMTSKSLDVEQQLPAGIDSWVRCFSIEERPKPLIAQDESDKQKAAGEWTVVETKASAIGYIVRGLSGEGIALIYSGDAKETAIPALLQTARALSKASAETKFLMICCGGSAASFARTAHLELGFPTCVLHFASADHVNAEIVANELRAMRGGYVEATYRPDGERMEQYIRLLPSPNSTQQGKGKSFLTRNDVLLVTGGGKGIAAECAFQLAKQTGAKIVLTGRSRAGEDAELSANLARFSAAKVDYVYVAADVADVAELKDAIGRAEQEAGKITAVLHGAGVNTPKLLASLEESDFYRTVGAKVIGLRNVLHCLTDRELRLVAGLGSIIARTGMPGEADYGTANEWMTQIIEAWGREHPGCRTVAIESSIWSGAGMGQRLGRVESLMQQGVMPISVENGIRAVTEMIEDAGVRGPVILTSRFGAPPTLKTELSAIPLLRFLENVKVFYPRVELIAEGEIAPATDSYLSDHVFEDVLLFPAVMGMEAMAQAATVLGGPGEAPAFEDLHFDRAITVPADGSRKIRVLALAREPGVIAVAVRSDETAFQVDHFRAVCRFEAPQADRFVEVENFTAELIPAAGLYENLFFQAGRFQRLRGYRKLSAFECEAEIEGTAKESAWFSRYLPQDLVLGDAGVRDAVIHSIQACIPHRKVLPTAVKRIRIGGAKPGGDLIVCSCEISRQEDRLTHDVVVTDAAGRVVEVWESLELRIVGDRHMKQWLAPLLGPYIERSLAEQCDGVLVSSKVTMGSRNAVALQHRPDGKPEREGEHISLSHSSGADKPGLTMTLSSENRRVGCDIENVSDRSYAHWSMLLGSERMLLADFLSKTLGEDINRSATRVWCAGEALKKAGAQEGSPLVYSKSLADGWTLLRSGDFQLATFTAKVSGVDDPIAYAVVLEKTDASVSVFA